MNYQQKLDLIAKPVTINGHDAAIAGAIGPFAVVKALHKPYVGNWSWEAVQRVVAAGGNFKL